jgi:hypothetical protein
MRVGFRTQSRSYRHPDGETGLLQIFTFSNKAINRPGECRVKSLREELRLDRTGANTGQTGRDTPLVRQVLIRHELVALALITAPTKRCRGVLHD